MYKHIEKNNLDRLQLDRLDVMDEPHRERPDLHPERVAQEAKRRRRVVATYSMDLSTIPDVNGQNGVGMLFPNGLHLPDDLEITSVYIEHHGTVATLQLYEGPSGSGRLLTYIKPGTYKRWLMSSFISSINVFCPANDAGLVTVILTTHKMDPNNGSL